MFMAVLARKLIDSVMELSARMKFSLRMQKRL
jgi:hypothetical protein